MTMRRRLPHLTAALLFALLALAAQRSLAPVAATHVYAQNIPGNDSLLHVWTLAWDHHALWTSPRALFDANIFFPHRGTLLYSDHLLGLALLLAPLRLVTDDVVLVHNVAVLAAPALNALAMYALVFGLVHRAGPALVAGLLYGFAPLRFDADRTQIQMLAAWWLPLLLHWGRRAVERGRARDAVAAGAALALQGLTGIYLTAFFAPFLALAHLWWLVCYPWRAHRRGWVQLVAADTIADYVHAFHTASERALALAQARAELAAAPKQREFWEYALRELDAVYFGIYFLPVLEYILQVECDEAALQLAQTLDRVQV